MHFEIQYVCTCIYKPCIVCATSLKVYWPAHKEFYGYAGYVDDPLPNIVYIALWMPAWLYYEHFVALLCIPLALCGVSDCFILLISGHLTFNQSDALKSVH